MLRKIIILILCLTFVVSQYSNVYLDIPDSIPHDGYGGISRDGWKAINAVHRAHVHSAIMKAEYDRVQMERKQFEKIQEETRNMIMPSNELSTSEPYYYKPIADIPTITSFHSSFSPTPSTYSAMIY